MCPTKDNKFTLICEAELAQQERTANNLFVVPVCVIQRVLAGQRKEEETEEDWLRTNIFHTRFEYKGKAFNVIIGNGSGMNVASQETVHKLRLPVERHPNPYKHNWVDDTSITVKTRCLIAFFIGKSLLRFGLV